jgi:adenosylhomocysteine nucleosidase
MDGKPSGRLHAAVLGAMDCEIGRVMGALSGAETLREGSWELVTGDIGRVRVTAVRCGIGTANAAACAALALREAKPDLLIIQGTAGAHSPELRRGDLVLAERLVNIGAYMSDPHPEGSGVRTSLWKPFETELMLAEPRSVYELCSSDELLAAARGTAEVLREEGRLSGRVICGTVGSGDIWNRELARIAEFRSVYGTDCEDMESYSAAQVCASFGVPFLCVRVISNSELTGEEYERETASAAQDFTLALLERLGRSGIYG